VLRCFFEGGGGGGVSERETREGLSLSLSVSLYQSLSITLSSLFLSSCGFGWRIHCGAEVTESSTNNQHTLSLHPSWSLYLSRESERGEG
jgi:hypothetical protein